MSRSLSITGETPIKGTSKLSWPGIRALLPPKLCDANLSMQCVTRKSFFVASPESTRPLYFLPLFSSFSLLYVYIYMDVYTYLYVSPNIHAYMRRTSLGITHVTLPLTSRLYPRSRFPNYSQTTVAFYSNIPGGSGLYRVYHIHRYRTRCTTRQVIIVVPRHYARRDEHIPIEKSTTGNEEGSFLPRCLVFLLDCFHRCIFCKIYTTSVETPKGRALRKRRKRTARNTIARAINPFSNAGRCRELFSRFA